MKNKYIDVKVEETNNLPDKGDLRGRIEEYMKVYDKCLNTYVSKNIDYGNSFSELFQEYGLKSSIIRLTDKLNRIKQLEKQGQRVDDENLEDTIEDLINYSVMTLIELRSRNISKYTKPIEEYLADMEDAVGDNM